MLRLSGESSLLVFLKVLHGTHLGFPGGSDGKESAWVQSLGWEDPLGKCMATHSSILTWRIPMDRRAWQAIVHGVAKSPTQLSD